MSEIFFFQIFAFHIFAFHISCSLFFDDFINDYIVFAWNILHFYKIWQWKGNSLGFDCVNIMKWIILCIWQLGIVIETNCDISPLMFFLRLILAATEKKYSKLCELYLKLQVASFLLPGIVTIPVSMYQTITGATVGMTAGDQQHIQVAMTPISAAGATLANINDIVKVAGQSADVTMDQNSSGS